MAAILLYSENTKYVQELATAGRELAGVWSGEICVLAVDRQQAMELAEKGLKVYYANGAELPVADTSSMAVILREAAEKLDAQAILLASNRRGKELAGRISEAWQAGCLTDVKSIILDVGQAAFTRNTLGGAAVATQTLAGPRKVVAFTPRSFAPYDGEDGSAQGLEMEIPRPSVKVIEKRNKSGDAVDIQAAERLVIVGQGVENQSDMDLVEKIAKALDAEIACSKPVASDKKWLSEDRVVGLSGKICKPALALILGVSGQVQFTVGVREAQVIISINNDENAFINKMSDYNLQADLKEALPELWKALQ